MPNGLSAQGTKFAYSDGGSPSAFTNIGNVTGVSGLGGGSAAVNDVSNLDSTFREKLLGLPDEGQVALTLNLDPDNSTHQYLRTARKNRSRLEFKITLPDVAPGTTAVFFGYVLQFRVDIATGKQITGSCTIEIDGEVAWN